MKTLFRFTALTFVTALLACPEAALSAPGFVTYKNADYGFSFSYPSDWKRESPRSSIGVVKISSQNGYGDESCNIAVHRSPSLRGKTTHQAVRTLTPSMVIGELSRVGVTDAIVIESGLTKVFNRDAYYSDLSYSIETLGAKFPVRALQVVTTKSDIVYTFSCGTLDLKNINKAYTTFRVVIGSVFIDP